MSIKRVASYQHKGFIFLQAYSRTPDGAWTLDGDVCVKTFSETRGLGVDLIRLFKESKSEIPEPETSILLEATKLKNWHQLMKKTHLVSIYKESALIKFIPRRFRGVSGHSRGYDWIYDKAIITDDLSPENLGKLLMQAMALSENYLLDDA